MPACENRALDYPDSLRVELDVVLSGRHFVPDLANSVQPGHGLLEWIETDLGVVAVQLERQIGTALLPRQLVALQQVLCVAVRVSRSHAGILVGARASSVFAA